MSFVWSQFLDHAKSIQTQGEAQCRTAISRAYYAVYCTARDKLAESQIQLSKSADTHEQVRNYFNLSGDYDSKKIAAELDRLRVLRNNSDYDLTFNGDPNTTCQQAILKAENSLKRLSNFSDKVIEEIKSKI